MTATKEETLQIRVEQKAHGRMAMREYLEAQDAMRERTARLRELRLARDEQAKKEDDAGHLKRDERPDVG